jgi:four helix bundle protein
MATIKTMATINRFEDLKVWQSARELSKDIFVLTSRQPFSNDFRFRDQIRAAAGSVMDNIAEGFERSSQYEFINFLGIAKGSAGEVQSQLYLAFDQLYISREDFEKLIDRYKQLAEQIAAFIKYLNKSEVRGQKYKDRT